MRADPRLTTVVDMRLHSSSWMNNTVVDQFLSFQSLGYLGIFGGIILALLGFKVKEIISLAN